MMINKAKAGILAALVCGSAFGISAAHASGLTMLLVRSTLSNDSDADGGGLWQYEGGVVQNAAGTTNIGHYILNRRVTTSGTSADNTASETITLFFSSATPGAVPNNITLEGAYSYNTGQVIGSVSAVSSRYRPLNGEAFSGAIISGTASTKIVIDFGGLNAVP
jgi:hypothetical protein